MDPLSSLSVAGTTIQFVQFVASLLNSAKAIHSPAAGLSNDGELLETIYGKLSSFSAELGADVARNEAVPGTPGAVEAVQKGKMSTNESSIAELARLCKSDCDSLLAILDKIRKKGSSGPKWWKSFQAALLEAIKAEEVKAIKTRIDKTQTQMMFYLCLASSEKLTGIATQLSALKANTLVLQRTYQYDEILQAVQQIQARIDIIRSTDERSLSTNDVEILTSRISELSLQSQTCAWEDGILRSLNYDRRPARHDSIPEAYKSTFKWIFKSAPRKGRMLDWLEKGEEVFWVSGKPGSGKSTLIKFIADDRRTRAALRIWGGDKSAAIASHYFWGAGTPMQRSQEGLLRSLLYNIFSQSSHVIPLVCPDRWADVMKSNTVTSGWSLHELSRALLAAAKQPQLGMRFCIFIDGLDEYTGDHGRLSQMALELGKCPGVKLCVSSRPWNDFLEHFVDIPKLNVHDLTQDDIRHYTEDELCKHSRWRVVEKDRRNGKTIVDEITTRAQDVFLWVFLVIRHLRESLTNYDSALDLWKRLSGIPSDLEKFFKQILESVEPFYHDKMAETLMIAAAGREPLHGAIYSFHDLSFENKDYATQEKVVPWSFREFVEFMEPFSRRLSSRTKGLLEVNSLEGVDFLHRTVRDFLRTSDMMKYLAQKARTRFDPSLAIFQGYICWIKHARFLLAQEGFFFQATQTHLSLALEEVLSYASDSDEYKNPFDTFVRDLIDDLEFSIQSIFSKCILRSGLGDYSLKKMAKMPGFLDDLEVPPLALIMRVDDRRKATDSIEWTARRINLLRALLERKHDPNQIYQSPCSRVPTTAWCEYIRQLIPYPSLEDETLPVDYPCGPFVEAVSKGVFSTLLEFGADPNGLVEDNASPEPLPIWAKFFLACFSARDVAQHGDIYLKNLETMMRAADLEASTRYLQPLGQWILGQDADALSQSIGMPVTFQVAVWNILQHFLGQLSKQNMNFRTMQFYANVIRTFLQQSSRPTLPIAEVRPVLRDSLPLGLVSHILDGLECDAEPKTGLKRKNTKDEEEGQIQRQRKVMRIFDLTN
ncbi:hypothetical protein QBC37DRAFT_390760 [Rhypophila decipiens]|uniref:NACHT domain-containing protein n=1 Tax=Rhypophila decipiens TaxID=261697 RepID=A0AAN7B4L8_9PEZI|nr:hypothetical protein QBC37DRAFT_390760 [Rhypophila decipiens]